jgi:hypothetical protein
MLAGFTAASCTSKTTKKYPNVATAVNARYDYESKSKFESEIKYV